MIHKIFEEYMDSLHRIPWSLFLHFLRRVDMSGMATVFFRNMHYAGVHALFMMLEMIFCYFIHLAFVFAFHTFLQNIRASLRLTGAILPVSDFIMSWYYSDVFLHMIASWHGVEDWFVHRVVIVLLSTVSAVFTTGLVRVMHAPP